MQVVSERRPTEDEWQELLFAWRVCKHVSRTRSCWREDGATIGSGAGPDEPRRLGSARAREGQPPLRVR